ncbi:MAG: BACON domain-containing protein [Alistipes sp.]|nr:BACON domain-containing protein [Alistipes sp.]
MKKFLFSLGLVAMMLNLTNCAQYEDVDSVVEPQGDFALYASVSRTANDSKNTVWVADDQINVFHAEAGTENYLNDTPYLNNAGTPFVCKDATEGYFLGTLNGGQLDATKSYDWYAFYPYKSYIATPANDSKGYAYIGGRSDGSQTQNGNDSMAHIAGENYPMAGYAKGVVANEQPKVVFSHIASLIEFEVVNGLQEAIKVSEINFTAGEDIVGSYYINFADYDDMKFTPSGDNYISNTAKLTVVGGEGIEAGKSAKFYMAVKPFTAAEGSELKVSVAAKSVANDGNGTHEKTITLGAAHSFDAGKLKNVKVNYTTAIEAPAEGEKVVTVNCGGGDGTNKESIVIAQSPFIVTVLPGNHTTSPRWDSDCIRVYGTDEGKHNILTITSNTDPKMKIKSVVLNCTTNDYAKPLETAEISAVGGGSVVTTVNGSTATMTTAGDVDEIQIQAYGQWRIKSMVITYLSDGSEVIPEAPVLNITTTSPIEVAAIGGEASIAYEVANAIEGVNISASTTVDWISKFVYTTAGKVSFTVTENTDTKEREAVITLAYTGADSKTVTVKQAAGENTGGEDDGNTERFVKVTAAPSDWSGTYLIVYESGNVAFDGSLSSLDTASNTKTVVISNDQIVATATMKAITFTIAKNGTNYTIKSASGKYIGNNSDSNSLATGTTALNNTIAFVNADDITIKGNGGSYLRYNATSGQTRFRYFKSGTYTSQKAIQLYKLVGEGGGSTPEPEPATPVLSINPTTLSFDAAGGDKTVACTIENEVSGQNVTATESVDWLSTSVSGKTVTINATANTGAARTAEVTIAYTGAESKTVTVSQAEGNTGGGDEPSTGGEEVTTKYTFSSYAAGTQYAKNEAHKLDDVLTITTTDCHFTGELRIYSSNTNNGYAIGTLAGGATIKSLGFNAGNKKDTLNVYGSTDGNTWTLVSGVAITSTSYNDYSVDFGDTNYTHFKLDVAGTNQVRLKTLTLTYVK